MEEKKRLLIIFVRNPEKGKVKKRLAKDIGEEAALRVYLQLLEHTHAVTNGIGVSKEIFYSEHIPQDHLWNGYEPRLQKGEALGERMERAFQQGFQEGFHQIVLIGSDLPELRPEDLQQAFLALDTFDHVLGPAEDGGYYLIGMKSLNSKLFRNKTWGTNKVLEETLKDLKYESNYLLDKRRDLDTYEDLETFPQFQQYLKMNR